MLPHASHALCFHEPKKAPCSANRQKAARDPLSNRTTGTQREDYIQMPIAAAPGGTVCACVPTDGSGRLAGRCTCMEERPAISGRDILSLPSE